MSDKEREILTQWIRGGAKYEQHWAFVKPKKPAVPSLGGGGPSTEIDRFLQMQQQENEVAPAAEADPYTLVRRIYVSLIGILPTIEEADEFVHDSRDDAYARLVTKLLASKHYGERWARPWLDMARYSDTNGYEKDRPRSIWPYRDWVIDALNNDMPFDQFTVEQLAGDMLPDATLSQRIATGFHRNTMLNEEGGIDPLEYRFYAMVDRVATTSTVWMGLTMGCAQCHTHKYDPISHTDYYRFMALLNNADEPDLATDDDLQRRRELQEEIDTLEASLPERFPDGGFDEALSTWIADQQKHAANWVSLEPTSLHSNLPKLEKLADNSIFASGDFTKRDEYAITLKVPTSEAITAIRLEVLPDERLPAGGPGRAYYEGRKGDFFLSELTLRANEKELTYNSSSRSFGKIAVGSGNAEATNVYDGDGSTGWSTATREGERHSLVLNLEKPIVTSSLDVKMLFERHFVAGLGRFRFAVTTANNEVRALDLDERTETILASPQSNWSEADRGDVALAFARRSPQLKDARKPVEKLQAKLSSRPFTMVMQERPADNPRNTNRHHRGEWLSPREEVTGGVPAVFAQREIGQPANRLELAKWLVSENNPLVARVVVNRAWRQLMGYGLVRSDGDFGTQADPPTHPALLDWLATEFVENGWSMKWLHRKIVTSAAYRQQSNITPAQLQSDPQNRFFARATRYRVDAETVRDMMLSASGLLSPKIGGPSVRPPQPKSVTSIAYGSTKWDVSAGEDRYRRSLYTFNKRTAPFAAYTTFDGPTGENCIVKRNRSNTPLQSLTLLNDEMFMEFARALGQRAAKQAGSVDDKIEFMFRCLLTRPPTKAEKRRLVAYHEVQQERFAEADEGLDATEVMGDASSNTETATLVLVARVLMNLDEVITQH